MNTDSTIEKEVVETLQGKFCEKLLSVIIFGSRAQGRAMPDSDYDFLTVVSNGISEEDRRVRRDLMGIMVSHQISIESVVVTLEELRFMAENRFPLILGVLLGYRVLYGKTVVEELLKKIEEKIVSEGGKKYIGSGLWLLHNP